MYNFTLFMILLQFKNFNYIKQIILKEVKDAFGNGDKNVTKTTISDRVYNILEHELQENVNSQNPYPETEVDTSTFSFVIEESVEGVLKILHSEKEIFFQNGIIYPPLNHQE